MTSAAKFPLFSRVAQADPRAPHPKHPSWLKGWSLTWLRTTSKTKAQGTAKDVLPSRRPAPPQSCPVVHKFPWRTLAVAVLEWLIAGPAHAQSQWPKDKSIPPHHASPSFSCNGCAVVTEGNKLPPHLVQIRNIITSNAMELRQGREKAGGNLS